MKELQQILGISWAAKKTDEWVLEKIGVEGQRASGCSILEEVVILQSCHVQTRRQPGESDSTGKNASSRARGRSDMTWMGNIRAWET